QLTFGWQNNVISDYMRTDTRRYGNFDDPRSPHHSTQSGPFLTVLLTLFLVGLCALIYWQGHGSVWSVRVIDRWMVRISVILFSASFAASAVAYLFPNGVTRWVLRNDRNLTISFGIAFALHLCAIARFHTLAPTLFWVISPPL